MHVRTLEIFISCKRTEKLPQMKRAQDILYKLRALAADPVSAHADLPASVRHIRIAAHKFYISPSRRWRDITEDEIKFILCWILSLYQEL